MSKYTALSEQLLENIGGIRNITYVTHCATRLRVSYQNKDLIQMEKLENLPNSSGLIVRAGTIQVIIGPDVHDAYNEFLEVSGWNGTEISEDQPDEDITEISEEKRDSAILLRRYSCLSFQLSLQVE